MALESLNLYQNCLRSLPDSLLNLQALTYLNLRYHTHTHTHSSASCCAVGMALMLKSAVNVMSVCLSVPSRNQLSVLPAVICGLPLKVLIACNNKLVSLPEELGQLRHLTELVRPTDEPV